MDISTPVMYAIWPVSVHISRRASISGVPMHILCILMHFPDPTNGSPRQDTGTEEMTPREARFHVVPSSGFMFPYVCTSSLHFALFVLHITSYAFLC